MKKKLVYFLIAAMIAASGYAIYKGLYYRGQTRLLEELRTERNESKIITRVTSRDNFETTDSLDLYECDE